MGHGHLHHQHHDRSISDNVADLVDGLSEAQITHSGPKVKRVATYIRTVYKTMSPTFSGEIGGYSTQGQDDEAQPTEQPASTEDSTLTEDSTVPTPTEAAQSTESTATKAPESIVSPVATSSLGSTLAVATAPSSSIATSSHVSSSPSLSTETSSVAAAAASASSSKDSADQGTSAGAKAGIAFGVMGGVLLVGLIVFLIFNRRKKQMRRQKPGADNEKLNRGAGGDNLARMPSLANPKAPRISLRPVTQFLPNWNLDKNNAKGAAMNTAPAAANQWDRPGTSQSNHPDNPFGSGAERIGNPDPWTANGPAIGATAAGAAALMRKASMRKDYQRNIDLTVPGSLDAVPPSPAGTEFSTSSMPPGAPHPHSNGAAAIAAAGGPASSTVHRVQLDFKPTLEDEMELQSGELVRLLHEYDDGWALCIRLDRSRQGVVPRTCLSTRPVKPRLPQGGQRPGPPIIPQGGYPRGPNQPGGPMSPQGRPMTPQGRLMTPQGRPMTPQGQRLPQATGPRNGPMSPGPRPQSPGPQHPGPPNDRPQTPNGMNPRPAGPPGPSPMNSSPQSPSQAEAKPVERKPVPGQAY